MPCWRVQTVSLNLEKLNTDYLEAAVKALGWTMTNGLIQTNQGNLRIDGKTISSRTLSSDALTKLGNQLQKQTSIEIVRAAAIRNKWGVKQVAANKIVLRRN